MDAYILEKTRLELSGGRLTRKDRKGSVEASYDLCKLKRASVVETVDSAGVILTVALFSLTYVFYRYVPEGLWRWVAVVVSGAIAVMGSFGMRSRQILLEVGDDRILYLTMELPDQVCSFVAMVNQAREECGSRAAVVTPG